MDTRHFVTRGQILDDREDDEDASPTVSFHGDTGDEGDSNLPHLAGEKDDGAAGLLPVQFVHLAHNEVEPADEKTEHQNETQTPSPSQPEEYAAPATATATHINVEDADAPSALSAVIQYAQSEALSGASGDDIPPSSTNAVIDLSLAVMESGDCMQSSSIESSLSAVPFPHQSILRSDEEIPVLDSLCGEVGLRCALCPEETDAAPRTTKEEATNHFKEAHWGGRIEIDEGVNAALCHCCMQDNQHYHCPYCGCSVTEVVEMTSHISACVRASLERQHGVCDITNMEEGERAPEDIEASPKGGVDAQKNSRSSNTIRHKSIVRSLADVRLRVCISCCRGLKYHCPICPDVICKPQTAVKMRNHIVTNHWKFRVPHEDLFLMKCTSACSGSVNGRPLGPHWHCPLCARRVNTRKVMSAHLIAHRHGTHQRRRTNAEWATLLGPKDANLLFNMKRRESEAVADKSAEDVAVDGESAVNGHGSAMQTDALEDRGDPKQVFQTVAALLTQEMLAAIPGSISAFFTRLQEQSNVQYSTSDQWCLLQADWHTMSGVHDQLRGLLSCSDRVDVARTSRMATEMNVSAAKDKGATGQTPEEPESDQGCKTIQEDVTSSDNVLHDSSAQDQQDGLVEENIIKDSVEQGQQKEDCMEAEPLISGPIGATRDSFALCDASQSCPELAPSDHLKEMALNSDLFTKVGKSEDDMVVDLTETGESGAADKITTPLSEVSECPSFENGAKKTAKSVKEISKSESHIEKSKVAMPVKRGRGRPRKVPRPVTPSDNDVVEVKRPDHVPGRRRRGRLPKWFQDYETLPTDDVPDEHSERVISSPKQEVTSMIKDSTTTSTSTSVKRGRGRPPKCPTVIAVPQSQVPSMLSGEILADGSRIENENVTSVMPEGNVRKRDNHAKTFMEEADQIGEDVRGEDEDEATAEQQAAPANKRRKKDTVEAPAITISIDERTGDVLSVAVVDDTATDKVDHVKQEQNGNDSQPPEDIAIEGILTDGLSLARKRKLIICESCGRGYPDNHRYYQHVIGSSCIKKRKNRDRTFKVSAELAAIIEEVKREVTEPKCPLCQKTFKFLLHAKMHYAEKTCTKQLHWKHGLEQNPETGLYHCRSCNYSSNVIARVVMHEMRKHWKKTEQCPICRKSYSCQQFVREHIKVVHALGKERVVCDQCGATVGARLLQQHIKTKHDPTYVRPKPKLPQHPLVCGECGTFETMSYAKMARHRSAMHRVPDKKCLHCGQMYVTTGDLNRHIRYVHEGLNQLAGSCPQCGKTMAKKNLSAHIKMVHEKHRPHSCMICGRAFLTKYTLMQHVDTHKPSNQRDTKFLCAFCGKGFGNRTHYTDHLNMHTGARPYTCNICNKTFRCNPALHKHKELHRTISLHCDICRLHFPSRKALRIHNNKEHVKSEGIFRCVCDAEYNSQRTLTQHQLRCGQWQQANPQENPNVTQVLDANLQNQMAMILQHSDIDQTGPGMYIVLEQKDGDDTVMVLQSLDNIDAADVVSGAGMEIMTVSNPNQPAEDVSVADVIDIADESAELKSITESEVLATYSDNALTNITDDNNDMQAINIDTDEENLLTIPEDVPDVDEQHQDVLALQEAAEKATQREDLNRYLCGYCQQLFTTLEEVQTHMLSEHVAAEGDEVELALHTPNDADTKPEETSPAASML